MKNITVIALVFGFLLVLFSNTSAATVRTVDTLIEPAVVSNPCTPAPNDCGLSRAIEVSDPGDTVNFAPFLHGQTIVLSKTVVIVESNILIDGPGAHLITVTSTGTAEIENRNGNNVTFRGLRFANGIRVFRNQGGLNLQNIVFENNSITPIINTGPLNISGSTFNNHQRKAISADSLFSVISISNSTFTNNHTGPTGPGESDGLGGAIYSTSGARLTVSNSNFANNSSALDGGAIYSSGTTLITGSNFNGNTCGEEGGGIYATGIVEIEGSNFRGNSAQTGGGLYSFSTSLERVLLRNSSIIGNTADLDGGGIYTGSNLDMINTTVSGNRADRDGGGIFLSSVSVLGAKFTHVTVANNSAGNSSGGLRGGGLNFTLSNSIVSLNTAPLVANTTATGNNNIINSDPGINPLGNYGGGIATHSLKCFSPALDAGNNSLSITYNGAPITVDQRGFARSVGGTVDIGAFEAVNAGVTNVSDNVADEGSLRKTIQDAPEYANVCFDQAFFSTPRTIAMSGSSLVIDKNLSIEGPGSTRLTLNANLASRHFTVMSSSQSVMLSGLTLTNGRSNISDVEFGYAASIFIQGSLTDPSGAALNATDLVISNGRDSYGCIYNRGLLNLASSTITGCNSSGLVNDPGKTVNIMRSFIHGNTAVQGAGIVNLGIMTVTDSSIRFNIANHPSGGSGSSPLGGGIFNFTPGTLRVDRSLVANNSAQLGGGLYNTGYAELKNSTFTSNSALQTGNGPTADGGAIYADGNYVGTSMATIDTINCTISGNAAVNSGGGVFMKQIPGSFAVQNMVNTINALNSAPAGRNISGEVISYGYNLVSDNNGLSWAGNSPTLAGNIVGTPGAPVDPKFAPFGDYGGPTPMLVLLPNSPAIDAGHPTFNQATDQRGVSRPIGVRGDIGAYERTITFNQSTIPNEAIGAAYNGGNGVQLSANRHNSFAAKGVLPESFAPTQFSIMPISGQQLPPGITLSPTGLLAGTPTALGTYTFTVKATDTDGIGGVQQYTMMVLAPTSASVMVSGRVVTAKGMPLKNATVVLTGMDGVSRTALTSSFGYYRFEDVETGNSYAIGVSSKRYQVAPQIINVAEEITSLDLTVALTSDRR